MKHIVLHYWLKDLFLEDKMIESNSEKNHLIVSLIYLRTIIYLIWLAPYCFSESSIIVRWLGQNWRTSWIVEIYRVIRNDYFLKHLDRAYG